MNPLYHQARFLTSAARLEQSPPDLGYEVAFAGRSNAGKSSALNALCQQKSLARTSKTPGRTQLLNFFSLDTERRLVDLPGYGYAKVADGIKQQWQRELARYLEQRRSLKGVVLLVDIRHPLKAYDAQMLEWSQGIGLPVHILLTKSDKLGRGAAIKQLQQIRNSCNQATVQLFSAVKKEGIEEALQVLDRWLSVAQKNDPGTQGE